MIEISAPPEDQGGEEMEMINLEEVKRASGLSANDLARLEEEVRREFESDEMMSQLHVIRGYQGH